MQNELTGNSTAECRRGRLRADAQRKVFFVLIVAPLVLIANQVYCAEAPDPLLDILLKKGILTEQEAQQVQAEVARRTNGTTAAAMESKWNIGKAIKNVELFGDVRFRYEHRQADLPSGDRLELDRERYAIRFGLRGDVFDDFYYGLRVETSANPRSTWISFGTSASGIPYQGPFGKSTASLAIGQAYVGWRPADWVDLTLGKMPNPLFTSSMVWDGDLNPEGTAEHFKHSVGNADFFANFGQFLYQDVNPSYASPNLLIGQFRAPSADSTFLLAWQGGLTYHFTENVSAKVAATLYDYLGGGATNVTPYFGDLFVGEGSYLGPGSAQPVYGLSGYPASGALTYNGYPNNQNAVNHLFVLEIPFEVNFKFKHVDARVFGGVAYNFDGGKRAEEAAAGYAYWLGLNGGKVAAFSPQRDDVWAYQIGLAIGSTNSLGLVSGSTCRKHAWELRTYWQHVEQYALDPNLLDSDFFEGRGNMEGIYAAIAYGLTDNLILTGRYGYGTRINDKLGTGGSNQDMPQVNPIDEFSLLQFDLTLKF